MIAVAGSKMTIIDDVFLLCIRFSKTLRYFFSHIPLLSKTSHVFDLHMYYLAAAQAIITKILVFFRVLNYSADFKL